MLNSLRRHSVFLFFSWMENSFSLELRKNLNDKVTSKMKKRLYLKERNKRYKNTRGCIWWKTSKTARWNTWHSQTTFNLSASWIADDKMERERLQATSEWQLKGIQSPEDQFLGRKRVDVVKTFSRLQAFLGRSMPPTLWFAFSRLSQRENETIVVNCGVGIVNWTIVDDSVKKTANKAIIADVTLELEFNINFYLYHFTWF